MTTYSRTNPPPGHTYIRLPINSIYNNSSARMFRRVADTLGIAWDDPAREVGYLDLCLLCTLERSTCGYPCGTDVSDRFVRTDAIPLLALEGVL